MSLPHQKGISILGMAVLLGILGDALLRATPWGINLPLWIGMAAAAGWGFLPDPAGDRNPIGPWPWATAMFFALCFAWRDSDFLRFWNAVAILCAVALPALQLHGVRLRLARISDYAMGLVASGANAALGFPIMALHDVKWQVVPDRAQRAKAIAVGAVLTIPILLVFGGLLTSADPGFERIVNSLVVWDFETLGSHVLLAGFFAWASAGYLRTLATGDDHVLAISDAARARATGKPQLGFVELGIPLGALSMIFIGFLIVQARYLFGGEAVILETAGLTYAEYARGGFFQLVTVATLLLPVLYGADWLLDRKNLRDVRRLRMVSMTLLVLIGLIMLSATNRMNLYVHAYGLTGDRFYAMAFMVWIGVVLALFGATVLRGRPGGFAFGAVTTGFGMLAVLNAINPDAIVARTNLSRAEAGAEFDIEYVSRLSADAVPELVARAPALLTGEQCGTFRETIGRETERYVGVDWRSWNLSRRSARRAVAEAGGLHCPTGSLRRQSVRREVD